jgi:nitrate reductase assembly molybdenum cofactor insertion protein NarJ
MPKIKFESLPPLVAKSGARKGEPASDKTMTLYKQMLNKLASVGFDTKAKILADPSGVIAAVTELTKDLELDTARMDARRRYYSAIFWPLSDAPESQKSPFVKQFRANMRDYSEETVAKPYVAKVKFPSKEPVYFFSNVVNKKQIVWQIVEKLKVGYKKVKAIATLTELPDKTYTCVAIEQGPVTSIRFGGKEVSMQKYQLTGCSHSLETFKKVKRSYADDCKITLYVGSDMDIMCA